MDNFAQLITAVQTDLNIGSETLYITPTVVQLAINRAYRKVAGMFPWPKLEDSQLTSTIINQEYYDYPQNWQPASVWKIRVDGNDLGTPLTFDDYMYEKENNFPSGDKTLWANQWQRYFITIEGVSPTTNGANNIEIWGQKVVTGLGNDNDVTIFSYSIPEVNEAIVLEAVSMLKQKEQDTSDYVPRVGDLKSIEAKQIITTAYTKISQRQAKYKKSQPFFRVPNFFPSKHAPTRVGDFNLDNDN